MEMEGPSSSESGAGAQIHSFRPRRSLAFYRFTQQNLPACKPNLTPGVVIAIFLVVGIIFVPVGLLCLRASDSVVEIVERYDIQCIPKEYRTNKIAYIKDSSISKNCTIELKEIAKTLVRHRKSKFGQIVPEYMKSPILVYYELDNYYQNHRRYVKSRSDKQLLHGLQHKDISSCSPEELSNGLPIIPCGLIAWSLFNDSYTFVREEVVLRTNRKNIAWESDRQHKFGKNVYPFNFQNGTLIGGGKLNPTVPLSEQEDLIIWMRTSALPKFRKLYGVIEEDLDAGGIITVLVANNYNTYSFGGMKKVVLTTTSWLGGKNNFLGIAYIITGICSIVTAILFSLLHVRYPRPQNDTTFLSWNRKN